MLSFFISYDKERLVWACFDFEWGRAGELSMSHRKPNGSPVPISGGDHRAQ